MSNGLTPASNSIFLDYMSEWNVVSFFKSVKRQHALVSNTIAISIILKGLTVVSTGLFSISSLPVETNMTFVTTHHFDGNNFDPNLVDSRPYAQSLGALSFNLSSAFGIVGNQVFQPFGEAPEFANMPSTFSGPWSYHLGLNVFSMDLDCVDANVTTRADNTTGQLTASGCNLNFTTYGDVLVQEANSTVGVTSSVAGCNGESSLVNGFEAAKLARLNASTIRSIDWRLWVYVVHDDPDGQTTNIGNNRTKPFKFTATMCTPKYEIVRRRVTVRRTSESSESSSEVGDIDGVHLDPMSQITPGSLLYAAVRSISISSATAFLPEYLLLSTSGNRLMQFLDPNILKNELRTKIRSISAQVAHEYLLKPAQETVLGTVQTHQTSLFLREVPFAIMVGMLVCLLVNLLLIGFTYFPVAVAPSDPGSIGGLALMFSRSPEFLSSFAKMDTMTTPQMQQLLRDYKYKTETSEEGDFKIIQEGEMTARCPELSPLKWWAPFSSKIWARILVLAGPIFLIFVFEALHRLSNRPQGIATVNDDPVYPRIFWTFLPALAMVFVRTAYETVDFTARVFNPYHLLRQGRAPPESTLLEDQHRRIAIYGLIHAFRKRYWAVFAAACAMIIAPFLPISVSGLYKVEHTGRQFDVDLSQTNRWNITDDTGHIYYAAGLQEEMLGGMIVNMNLSYPQWTYEDMVFPRVDLAAISKADGVVTEDAYIDTRLPALRANLNCAEVPPSGYVASWNTVKGSQARNFVANVTGIGNCGFSTTAVTAFPQPNGGFFSKWLRVKQETPADCPSRLYIYGKAGRANTTEGLVVLRCRPRVEEVDVAVRLRFPSMQFEPSMPPRVVGTPTRTLLDGFFGGTFKFEIFPDELDMQAFLMGIKRGSDADGTSTLDVTAQAAIFGRDGVPPNELLQPEKLIKGTNRVFGIVVAQLLNNWGNEPLTDKTRAADGRTYKGRMSDFSTTRLVQDEVLGRVAQALLVAMVFCGAASMVLMDTRRILPKNPCSIAAVASLLANARMMEKDNIPPGAEWYTRTEREKYGMFAGATFTLGFWAQGPAVSLSSNDDQNEDRFGIDMDEPLMN